LITLVLGSFLYAVPEVWAAVQVTLAWDPNSEPDLAGYKIHYGTSTRTYRVTYDAGNVNSCTISGLQEGATFYFAATAYDRYGNESDFSEEVVYIAQPLNNPPVAESSMQITDQDTAAAGSLTASDPDGDPLTFSVVTQGILGTATITDAATGAYTYTPNAGVTGSDSFAFQVRDPGGLTSTATVAVTIVAVNRAPVAQSGVLYTYRGATQTGKLVASDPDGDSLTFSIASQASRGTAVITNAAAGDYYYSPQHSGRGEDTFTFMVRDAGGLTATATITVRIISLGNAAPVANDGSIATIQDTSTSGRLSATDEDGDPLSYQIAGEPKLGSLSLDAATGVFTYTPQAGATGTDSFTFKANDGSVNSNVASFNVSINAHVKILLEAEKGTLSAPMVRAKDAEANNGKYILVRKGNGDVTDPLSPGGQAVYSFSVPAAGRYQVWARVIANNTRSNSFFISMDDAVGFAWHTALGGKDSWVWDRVIDNNEPTPFSFNLDTGTHTLVIKQLEAGTKLDNIMITTDPAWIPETVYGDAEDGTIDGWDVFDGSPTKATITNVFDEDCNSRVIQVAGLKTKSGYRLRSNSYTDWVNQSQFVIAWSMQFSENFMIYVEIETTEGYRYLQYEPLARDHLGTSSQVRLGLGADVKNGQWHTIVRDLQADLNKAQPGVTILQVNAFSLRGSGSIDEVKLRATK